MKSLFIPFLALFALSAAMCNNTNTKQPIQDDMLLIKKTSDFDITGDGSSENWSQTDWVSLKQLNNHENINYATKVKILYSDAGIYFLFDCEDEVLTATMEEDYLELWNEDVIELFLWPHQEEPVAYFEYELSPLNYELPLLISNKDGDLNSWLPFQHSYAGDRKIRHKTSVEGGEKKSGAYIDKWMGEIFIPFELLRPLKNISPESGTTWRANLYRIDYDKGQTLYAWQPIDQRFHEYEKFGTFVFE